MTVSSSTARADYNGNGSTTAFTVPFYFLNSSHLLVLSTVVATGVSTTLILNSDYTVTGTGVPAGGTVTTTVAPVTGVKLSILRNVPITQTYHYVPNDPFPAASHENALDLLTMEVQQVNEVVSRAVKLPASSPATSDTLPVAEANKVIGWNATGDGFQNYGATDNTLLALQLVAPTGSSLVGHIASATGAVARTVQSKLRDVISVKDFGAIGDGVTNDTTAIQAALTYGGAIYAPKGTYMVSGNLTGIDGTTLYGDGWNSKIKLINGSNPTTIITFGSEAAQSTIEISNLEIDGNKANNPTAGDGVKIIRGYKSNTHNLRIKSCKGNGLTHSATASAFENYNYNPSFYDNDGYGIQMTGTGMTDTHVLGGDIGYNLLGGVVLGASCSVADATIWGAGLNSVGVVAGFSSQIIGNKIEGHGTHGITVATGNVYIDGNKIYANSFNVANTGLYDGINIAVGANAGTITGNRIYSSVAVADPYVMRNAVRFEGAHTGWTIAGNDMARIGSLGADATGEIVYGVLSTDKCDFNWIKSNVLARRSANLTTPTAGAWTVLPLDLDDTDTRTEFSSGVFIPKSTGLYRIELGITFTAAAANENIGFALYTTAGVAVRRIVFGRSENVNAEMFSGVIDEFLTAGVSYDIRYFVGSASTTFLAGSEFTYLKIRAVSN